MSDSDENIVMRTHKYLKNNHPLAYEAAQIFPPVGMTAAALEGADAIKAGDYNELAKAALSAIPVTRAYRVGDRVARAARDVVGSGTALQKAKKVVGKAGAGENVAEAGEAGYKQGELAKGEQDYKRGGSVRGWGMARGAKKAKYR